MNGIEKITGRIDADAQKEIDELTAQAQVRVDEIAKKYDEQARREAAELIAKGKKSADERVERMASVAKLEAGKLTLAVKQEMLSRAFEQALDQLCNLPENEYVAFLAGLAVKAARTGREEVILSQKDRTRVGKAVVVAANEALAKQVAPKLPSEVTESKAGAILDRVVAGASALLAGTGMLTLSEESRPIRGGLILSDGDVEVNCTFETLVRLKKAEMAREVTGILF